MILVVVDLVVAVVDLLWSIAHLSDLSHVFPQGIDQLAKLLFHLSQSLNRQSLSVLSLCWLIDETWSHSLVLKHFYLRLQFDDFPLHFLLRLVDLWQFYLPFFEIHSILVQQIQLHLIHILEAFSLIRVESIILPQPIP